MTAVAFADAPAIFGFAFFGALGLLVGFVAGIGLAVWEQMHEEERSWHR